MWLHADGHLWTPCENLTLRYERLTIVGRTLPSVGDQAAGHTGDLSMRKPGPSSTLGLFLAVVFCSGCATFGRQHLDYTALAVADRLEVSARDRKSLPTVTITEPSKIKYAIDFILQRQDRWGDRVHPYVPTLVLEFYKGNTSLGGYGVSDGILVALPQRQGFWWRDVSEAEVSGLLKALEVEFPKAP